MKIQKIVIVQNTGVDKVILYTDLPEATYPFRDTGHSLEMSVAQGKGKEYCEKHFPGVPIDVVGCA